MVIGMPMSAIDLFTVAPRSAEAAGLVGREQNQIQHMGENGGVNFQKNVEQQTHRTVETNKSEKEEYRFDDSHAGGQGGNRKKKNKKRSQSQAPEAPRSDSSFDIMI